MVMNDMTDDGKWGAAIPIVDGKRPEWLENNLDIPIKTAAGWKGEVDYFDGDNAGWHWENITAIRLPADHPHYQQTQPINWQAPIEAVHEDGAVKAIKVIENDHGAMPYLLEFETGGRIWSYPDGDTGCGWRIRNVQPATQKQAQTLTAQERLDRLEALCRALSEVPRDSVLGQSGYASEARALVAEMEPVDPDLIEARNLVECTVHWSPQTDRDIQSGKNDETPEMKIALAAIKRGRELSRGEG